MNDRLDEVLLYSEETRLLELRGLKSNSTGLFVTGATLTAKIYDEDDAQQGGDVSMSYVAGSDATYRGTVLDSVALTPGGDYHGTVDIVDGSQKGKRFFRVVVKKRGLK